MLSADRPPYWNGPQLAGNWDVIWYYTEEHIRFTVIAVGLGMLFAFPIAYLAFRRPALYPPVLVATNIVYAIPSLALFALLGPFLGYTNDKAIILAMALYTLVILVRNIVEGLRAVPAQVTDAATGLGYSRFRRFRSVELPLAVPTIIAGLRLATVSTISLITVGGAIGKGALGRLFSDGISRLIVVELWAGVLVVMVLALVADIVILTIGRLLTPWTRAVVVVNVLGDAVRWLFDPDNWWGASGIIHRTIQHLVYSGWALLLAFVVAFPIGLLIGHTGHGRNWASGSANVLRAIPTYGVIALLFYWKPVTLWPLLLALAVLAVPPIMLNTAAGIANVDRQTRDAAVGVGLTGWQVLTGVEVPNALPLILAGVRSAANQVIATATILGFKAQGGLGLFIFSGYGTQHYEVVYGASIVVVLVVLTVEALFALLQRRLVSPGLRAAPTGNSRRSRKLTNVVGNLSATPAAATTASQAGSKGRNG